MRLFRSRAEFLESWELDVCDDNASAQIIAAFIRVQPGGAWTYAGDFIASPADAVGCVTLTAPASGTVDNHQASYAIEVYTGGVTDGSLRFTSARVRYRRQVSPGPGVATFADVPTGHGFFKFVEALYAAGITGGCGGGNYCPDSPLTRGQMAVFLASALGLHWPN